ncbi:unnamed protein product [Amoebophrya sp. A120]|nr:unnamed protein product [Amoebophrya sp. A120]|eukprot:GSA120T00008796001.1
MVDVYGRLNYDEDGGYSPDPPPAQVYQGLNLALDEDEPPTQQRGLFDVPPQQARFSLQQQEFQFAAGGGGPPGGAGPGGVMPGTAQSAGELLLNQVETLGSNNAGRDDNNVNVAGVGPAPGVNANANPNSQYSERIVDSFIQEGKFVSERVLEEKFVVGVKTFKIIEKVVEVPQVVVKEVTKVVRKPEIVERVIEKPKIKIEEVVKEIPIVKTVEKTVEVPEVIYEEKLTYVPKIVYEDRIIEIPKVEYKENVIYTEEVEYREYVVDKVEEDIKYETRTNKRYVEKPIAMRMEVPATGKLPGEENGPAPKTVFTTETQAQARDVEVQKVTFDEFPVRKEVPVPLYRMVFPDGSKKVATSIFGYPDLPKPKSLIESEFGIPFDEQNGKTPNPNNLGPNANLVNTTKPPPSTSQLYRGMVVEQQQQQQVQMPGSFTMNNGNGMNSVPIYNHMAPSGYRPVDASDNVLSSIHGQQASMYVNTGAAVSRFDQNSVHPRLRAAA